jgi:hypothetical protein
MAESGLSLAYSNLAKAVARTALGYSGTSTDWDTEETADITESISKGYSDFLSSHDWSFLKKFATITTTAGYSTGTITLADDDATVTLATGTWPSWAAQGSLYYDGKEYEVSSRTSDSEIELATDWSGGAVSGGSYELRRVAYDLPDDFGQPLTGFSFDTQYNKDPLKRVSDAGLVSMRSGYSTTSCPKYAAIRPKTGDFDNSTGQRFEVLFFPLADGAYTLGYSYAVLAENSLSTTNQYPLGGAVHGQTIQSCCIAAARYLFRDSSEQEYRDSIRSAVQDSIRKDNALAPTFLGYNVDRSNSRSTSWRETDNTFVTVDGVIPD